MPFRNISLVFGSECLSSTHSHLLYFNPGHAIFILRLSGLQIYSNTISFSCPTVWFHLTGCNSKLQSFCTGCIHSFCPFTRKPHVKAICNKSDFIFPLTALSVQIHYFLTLWVNQWAMGLFWLEAYYPWDIFLHINVLQRGISSVFMSFLITIKLFSIC